MYARDATQQLRKSPLTQRVWAQLTCPHLAPAGHPAMRGRGVHECSAHCSSRRRHCTLRTMSNSSARLGNEMAEECPFVASLGIWP